MGRELKLTVAGIILTVFFGIVGIIIGIIPSPFKDNRDKPSISDIEFTYNENIVKLELRTDVVLSNLIRDLNKLDIQDQNSRDSIYEDIGFYHKEISATSHVLHNYIVVPTDKYKPSYDSFGNSLNLTLELLMLLKEDIGNSEYMPLAYEQKINKVFKQLDVSKTYRSKLFVLHYTALLKEIELLSANLYESDEFERSIYYLKLLLPIYEEKAETKKIADTYYHLGLAYRKVGITGKYDLIKDLQKEDHELYLMKDIWLQMYCNFEAYYSMGKALSTYRQNQNRIEVATVLCILGSINTYPLDNPEQAIEYYTEAARLFSGTDPVKCAKILNAIGAIYYLKGRYLKPEEDEKRRELNNIALSYYKQSLNFVKEQNGSKNRWLLFKINYNIELIETNSRSAPISDAWY